MQCQNLIVNLHKRRRCRNKAIFIIERGTRIEMVICAKCAGDVPKKYLAQISQAAATGRIVFAGADGGTSRQDERKNMPPFKRGDIVICELTWLTVTAGDKLRVVKCLSCGYECGSGWMVYATKQTRGRLANNPTLCLWEIDSDWFHFPGKPSKL